MGPHVPDEVNRWRAIMNFSSKRAEAFKLPQLPWPDSYDHVNRGQGVHSELGLAVLFYNAQECCKATTMIYAYYSQ